MGKTYVINHGYHIDYVHGLLERGDSLVVISDDEFDLQYEGVELYCFPFFESSSVYMKVFYRLVFFWRIFFLIRNSEEVTLLGCQDVTSYKIYCAALTVRLFRKIEIRIVPDNIEFYLRYIPEADGLSVRLLVKALLYGCAVALLRGKVRHTLGRFVFGVEGNVSEPIYRKSLNFSSFISAEAFVSQPYYLDYSLNLCEWVDALDTALKDLGCINILFHPRDSEDFRSMMLSLGYKVGQSSVEYQKYYGVFSTYMASLISAGKSVHSIFNAVSPMLPTEYVKTVDALVKYGQLNDLDFGFVINGD